ncbi:MAG: TrmB family transcriptional regulator [Chthoniobacterales bacterium]|nr:TrmB family transcriptional regulator [Chthoniobacterales bacterium]
MFFNHRLKLEQLGLSSSEAQIYLAVLHQGSLAARAIASQTGIPRTAVYPTLSSLAEKGLIEGGLGHGSKFTAVAPEEALRGLISREEQTLSERQQIAKELTEALPASAPGAESALDDSVQVVRTPQLIGEKLHRLQLEATRLVEGIVKAPILMPRPWNPAQRKATEQGVHFKALYERAAIADPKVGPYLESWLAGGEEARVYEGELPYKLFVFDQEVVLSTLIRRGGHPAALLVRHAPFARSMSILFEVFWNQATPLTAPPAPARKVRSGTKGQSRTRVTLAAPPNNEAHNGASDR